MEDNCAVSVDKWEKWATIDGLVSQVPVAFCLHRFRGAGTAHLQRECADLPAVSQTAWSMESNCKENIYSRTKRGFEIDLFLRTEGVQQNLQ
jgi:hypothetical protein